MFILYVIGVIVAFGILMFINFMLYPNFELSTNNYIGIIVSSFLSWLLVAAIIVFFFWAWLFSVIDEYLDEY